MFKGIRWLGLAVLTAAGLAVPLTAFATNGYFLIGFGTKSRAMGGVGIGYAASPTAAAVNPANMVDMGTRVGIDAALFNPKRRSACCVGSGGVVSGSNLFLIPTMGGAYKFNRKMSIGFAAIGAGANTRFEGNLFFDDPTLPGLQPDRSGAVLGVNLIQMIMAPGAAYRLDKHNAVGASLQLGVQTFRASGLNDAFRPFSRDPNNLTERGNDWSYGAGIRLGWRSVFFDKRLTLGLAYASKVYMTRFHKYSGLFADEGGFDIPENFGAGLSIKPTDKLVLAFDVVKILYSDVPSVGNPALPISSDPANVVDKLGHRNGPGFGWKDQTVYKVGAEYHYNPKWTLRVGYNYGKTPIRENASLEFNVLAPATTEQHYTAGVTYTINKHHEVSFAGTYAQRNKLSTTIDGTTQLPFSGDVETELWIRTLEFGYQFKF